jgi:ribose-phosphate pyrophosphokinase
MKRKVVLIGPDIESEQWVSEAVTLAVLTACSERASGDRNVKITIQDLHELRDHTPVLIDDIVSSGRTMIEAARQLRGEGLAAPVCIAVHALFSQETEKALREVSRQLVTTTTVPHSTNGIDISAAIAKAYLTLNSDK